MPHRVLAQQMSLSEGVVRTRERRTKCALIHDTDRGFARSTLLHRSIDSVAHPCIRQRTLQTKGWAHHPLDSECGRAGDAGTLRPQPTAPPPTTQDSSFAYPAITPQPAYYR